jgi:tetratricopeptide (TPR) repeat protein
MAISLYNMALVLDRKLGDRPQARDAYQRAIRIFKETGNEKYLETLRGN